MKIYIVSYTSYDEYDNHIYTDHKPFVDYGNAFKAFKGEQNAAWDSITEEWEKPTEGVHEEKQPEGWQNKRFVLERNDDYMKIVVELTEHEI